MVAMVGRRDRMQHSEVCKKTKEDIISLLKGFDVPANLKEYVNQLSLEVLQRLVPYYVLLSEDLTKTILNDILAQLKKVQKQITDKFGQSDDSVPLDKFCDYLKDQVKGLTHDHLDLLKSKYFSLSKKSA